MKIAQVILGLASLTGAFGQSLEHRVAALERTSKEQQDRIAALENIAFPIGTVAAFAGPLDRIPRGWMHCDGSLLDKTMEPLLYNAIGNSWGGSGNPGFRLPDLRGRFLRGVDSGAAIDPDRNSRQPARPGDPPGERGNSGNQVGTFQSEGTKMPTNRFVTDQTGNHTHLSNPAINRAIFYDGNETIKGDTDNVHCPGCQEPNLKVSTTIVDAGLHSHVVGGGDSETRPANSYVYWIIRVR